MTKFRSRLLSGCRPAPLRCVVLAGILLYVLPAAADSWPRVDLPLKLPRELVVEAVPVGKLRQPVVRRGSLSTPLSRLEVTEVYLSPQGNRIELFVNKDWYFGEPITTTFSLDMLEARLENAAALKLHRSQRYEEAAQGFAKALRLDPHYRLAAYNLASALSRQGRKDQGAAVLAPLLDRELPKTYLAILQDPELLALLDTPKLAALRADPPGTAELKTRDEHWLAYSAKYNLLAALDDHQGLVVFSLRTGEIIAQLDMGSEIFPWSCEDCSEELEQLSRKARASAKVAFDTQRPLANRFLQSLGFSDLIRREASKRCEPGRSLCFAANHLRAEFSNDEDKITVYKNSRRVASTMAKDCSHTIDQGTYLPELQAMLYHWLHRHSSTERGPQAGIELLLLSPSASQDRSPPHQRCTVSEQAYSCE